MMRVVYLFNNNVGQQYYQQNKIMGHHRILKNLICVSFGLALIFVSGIFMISINFDQQIEDSVKSVSTLRDVKFQEWGQQPNPTHSIYTQNFTLYSHSLQKDKVVSQKLNLTQNFAYTYNYTNISFAQGNSGMLNYIEHRKLVQQKSNDSMEITTLNFGADKVFNYDYYAPPQRRFTILYNSLFEFLSNQFLEIFYAQYLYEYFFKDLDLVLNTVFLPLKYSEEDAKAIYNHKIYGWDTVDKFQNWAILSLKGIDQSHNHPFYQKLVIDLELQPNQINKLIYEKSTLYNMISALNGTIFSKLKSSSQYGYECQQSICSNRELASMQFATGFLTNQPLFKSLNLNKHIRDFNSSLLFDLEYSQFSSNHPQMKQVPKQNIGAVFVQDPMKFSDFEIMDSTWKNKEKLELIQSTFQLQEGTGKSFVSYIGSLYEEMAGKFNNTYSWSQTHYNHLQKIIDTYENMLVSELYSQAFENKYLDNGSNMSCLEYFVDDFAQLVNICEDQQWNIVNNLRKYIKAYFYIENYRDNFADQTSLNTEKIIAFFNNPQKSLFASQLQQIETSFKSSFNCSAQACQSQEIFCKQWGSGDVFPNLPSEYFIDKVDNILQWDQQDYFNQFVPDYFAQMESKLSVSQCTSILNSETGIYSLFNLNKMANAKQNITILQYISKLVNNVAFGGYTFAIESQKLINGYNSECINTKKNMDISKGGAPWLDNKMTLIKLNNEADIAANENLQIPQYNLINTGIYDQDGVREIQSIWGEKYSSSKYLLYNGTKESDDGSIVPVNLYEKYTTNRKVGGTNLLGFSPLIDKDMNLKAYFQQGYQPINLLFDQEIQYVSASQTANIDNKFTAYKYRIHETTDSLKINTEELNQNQIQISDSSYVIVEPLSGLTMEFVIEYRVLSNPLSLKYLYNDTQIIIYQSMMSYKRADTDQLQQIFNDIETKGLYQLIDIILCGIFLGIALISSIMYLRFNAKSKKQSLLVDSYENMDSVTTN